MKRIRTKVCIIGSGVAGCLCAKHMISKIDDVVIVERGARIDHSWRMQNKKHEQEIPTAAHHHSVVEGWKEKQFSYVYAAGGSTNHWTGQTPRFLPADFRMKSLYGVMEDWPISYEDLEAFYCLAEEELSIAGASDNPRSPRSKEYPLLPHPLSPVDSLVRSCFPEGMVVSCPQARPSRDVGTRPSCCGSGVCHMCPVDSKYTPMNSHIPELEKLQQVRFLYETVVLGLRSNGNRQITAAIAKQRDEEFEIEADFFVLAANGLENPGIILRSPGLKKNINVGKYIFDHAALHIYVFTSKEAYPFHGASLVTAHNYYYYDGPFRSERAGALGEIFNTAGVPIHDVFYQVAISSRHTGEHLRKEVTEEFRSQIGIAFLLEDMPEAARYIRIGNRKNPFGIPVTEISYPKPSKYLQRTREHIIEDLPQKLQPLQPRRVITEFIEGTGHILGTCRMGDQEKGVVDDSLRYHGTDNLYIVGGSAFPTYSPANPTLTIAALAIRLGKHIQTLI